MTATHTEQPTDTATRHEAIGPYIVADARGWTAGYTIACACGWQSGELRVLDSRHPELSTPQIAAIRDHWKHLLDVSTTKESA